MSRPTVSDLLKMMDSKAHIVAISIDQSDIFGTTYQPVCLDCDYVGGYVTDARAHAIATEHRRKSLGTWEPAR